MKAATLLARALLGAATVAPATAAAVVPPCPPLRQYVMRFAQGRIAVAPPSPELELGAEFTIEAWVRLEWYQGSLLLGKYDGTPDEPYGSYALFLANGRYPAFLLSDGTPGEIASVTGAEEVPLRTWTHLAATLSTGTMRVFVNGAAVASTPSPGVPAPNPLRFGVGGAVIRSGGVDAFDGALREVRVWNRALTAVELAEQAGTTLTGREPGLIAYWPLHDGAGQVARDLGPNRLHLQRGLSPTWASDDPGWIRARVADAGPFFELEVPFEVVPPCDSRTVPCLAVGDVIDFDTDGDPDLLLARAFFGTDGRFPYAPMLALRNDGSGRFDDATADVCPDCRSRAIANTAVDDFDRDGRMDVLVGDQGPDHAIGPGGQNHLLLQTADGRLEDVTAARLPLRNVFTHAVCAGDFTDDGLPDLFVSPIFTGSFSGYGPAKGPRLHVNDGQNGYSRGTEMLPEAVERSSSNGWSCLAFDANRDGHLDLAIGGGIWPLRDTLLLNDGHGKLVLAPETALPPRQGTNAMHMTSADLDGDGWADMLHWDQNESPQPLSRLCLYLNNRDGTFRDASRQLRLTHDENPLVQAPYPRISDFNRDGWPDFIVGGYAGNGPRLMLNGGRGHFLDGEEFMPLFRPGIQVLPADFDGDGDIDVVITSASGSTIWLLRQVKAPDLSLLQPGTLPLRRRLGGS